MSDHGHFSVRSSQMQQEQADLQETRYRQLDMRMIDLQHSFDVLAPVFCFLFFWFGFLIGLLINK